MTREETGLRCAAGIVIAFGILTALAAWPPLNPGIVLLGDLLIWPLDGRETGTDPMTRLMFAIGGGVLAAWGWLIWRLTAELLPREPALARSLIRQSVLTWFVIDSTGSVLAGAPANVVGNLAFLALFLVPLAWGRRDVAA